MSDEAGIQSFRKYSEKRKTQSFTQEFNYKTSLLVNQEAA